MLPFILLLSAALLWVYHFLLHPLLLSPTRHIPAAHWLSRFSPLWILYQRYQSHEVRSVHAAHQTHGPIILLSPSEISVNSVDNGIRSVYAGNFEKNAWYTFFENFGKRNMFSMVDAGEHGRRKRMVSHVYSKSFVLASEAMRGVSRVVVGEKLVPLLRRAARRGTGKGKGVDVYLVFNAATMDSITGWIFGVGNSTAMLGEVEREGGGEWREWLYRYWGRFQYRFWGQEVPGFTRWMARIGIQLVPESVRNADGEIGEWVIGMCEGARRAMREVESGVEVKPEEVPTVYSRLRTALVKERESQGVGKAGEKDVDGEKLVEEASLQREIASELWDHTAAGFDTSGIFLTYAAWELSRHPEIQARLHEELLTLSPPLTAASASSMPYAQDVDNLPLLHAVVMETLRLHPSIPGSQPRSTPNSSCTLGEYAKIPGGIRVNAQAYSLHRNENAFPKAEEWIPDRWLANVPGETEKKERWFWAFGSGGRMCVGSNFAMNSNKFILAAVYSNFKTVIEDDDGIEQEDGYTAPPEGKRLILKFAEIEQGATSADT